MDILEKLYCKKLNIEIKALKEVVNAYNESKLIKEIKQLKDRIDGEYGLLSLIDLHIKEKKELIQKLEKIEELTHNPTHDEQDKFFWKVKAILEKTPSVTP